MNKQQVEMKAKNKEREILWVQVIEPKPNKMFSPQQHAMTRFLRFNWPVPCAECGKKKRTLWTQLHEFYAADIGQFVIANKSKKIHQPLTPVCTDHLLGIPELTSEPTP